MNKLLWLALLVALVVISIRNVDCKKKGKGKGKLFDGNGPKGEGGESSGGNSTAAEGDEEGGDDDDDDDEEEDLITKLEEDQNLGKKDCTNQKESDKCVEICEQDKDCALIAQESLCESNCFATCKYLDLKRDQKCVNHMVAHISYYRDFPADGKGKVKPSSKNKKG